MTFYFQETTLTIYNYRLIIEKERRCHLVPPPGWSVMVATITLQAKDEV
jgi:hypothetical protein